MKGGGLRGQLNTSADNREEARDPGVLARGLTRYLLLALVPAIACLAVLGVTAKPAGAAITACTGSGETFAGGDGTSATPYLVSNQAQLVAIRSSTYRTCAFQQTTDINLTGSWIPIGTGADMFSGEFDGGSNRISGLSITTGSAYEGLFGYSGNGAVIKNIRLSGTVNLPGVFGVGALVGLADRPTTITNVHSSVNVTGGSRVGGLVGWLAEATIRRSSSTGQVTGTGFDIGGLVGQARSQFGDLPAEISNSYATGSVGGGAAQQVGGLVGGVDVAGASPYAVLVSNSYSTGSVSGATTGGLIGQVSGSRLTVTGSFWDTETSGKSSSAGGTGKTTAEMKSFSTFNGASWDITDGWSASTVWGICEGSSYPFLSDQYTSSPCTAPVNDTAPSISGTAKVGQTLTADKGSWSATPAVPDPSGYAYRWQRCETNSVAGVDWTTRTAPSSQGWRSVVWGGDKFVAVGGDVGESTADDVLTSADGADWTAHTAAENNYWTSVAWGAGTFVAVSSNGTNRVMTSPDGETWTARGASAQRAWKSVTWGGPTGQEKFVAVAEDGGVMTSPDGTTWTSQTQPGGVDRDWRSVTWGDPPGATPGQFVAVAYGGTTAEQVMTSPDGITWTARTSAVARGWFGVTWGGTPGQEKFVAVSLTGDGDQVMTSPDGVTWTARTSPAGNRQWHSVAWGGPPGQESFVAVSDTGAPNQVMTSPNGITWTVRSSSSGEKWRAVTWGGPAGQEKFVSVAYDQPPTAPAANRVMTSQGATCADISGAINPTYTAQTADFNKYLRVRVTASNGVSPNGVAYSPISSQVAGIPPTNTTVPSITGTAKVRETLTASPGSWSANPSPPSYAYQWERCTATVTTSTTAVGQLPAYLTVDSNGNVYTSNYTSQTVTKVTPGGTATTFGSTGTGPYAIAVDRDGNVYTADNGSDTVTKITPAGVSSTLGSTGTDPIGIAVDSAGNVYTANYGSNNVTKITPGGSSSILGGTGSSPYGIAVDSAGNVYTSNFNSNSVTKFPSGGSPTTLATTGSSPVGIAVDSVGNVYTANFGSNDVTKITPGGSPSTLGSTGANPYGLALDSAGNVYTADAGPDQVTKITPGGSSSVLASTGTGSNPRGIGVSSDGSVYTADSSLDRITKISQYSCSEIFTANSPTYVAQPADTGKYLRVKVTATNGASPDGISYSQPSGPVLTTPSRTLYVNKYPAGESDVPGCENPDFTEIGSADPSFGAVGAAVSGDTIFICGSPGAATDPTTPTTGPYRPAVVLGTKSLTFVGEGPELTILDGENDRTLFFANAYDSGQANSYLNLQSLTVKRGLDINDGGGIEAFCRDMALSNVRFADNRATGFGGSGGGGISVQEPGCLGVSDVTVNSSVFTGNIADRNPAYGQGSANGGAIRTTGSLTIDGSRFQGNEARATDSSGSAPRGGAVWAGGGVTITDSSFISNGVVGPGAFGGAIYSEGGPSTSTITGSTFSGNSATGTNNFAGAVRRVAGDLTVTNSTFTGNQATDAPAISSSDSITLKSVTSSANSGPYDIDAGYTLSIGNSIINETGEACRAPLPPSTYKVNLGGNVIADTTLSDCDPFVGTGGGPASKVAASAIQLGALADNGGPTQTMALGLTSVAASSAGVNLLGASPKDQRGRMRPGVNQSSGAYQLTEPANSAIPQISGTSTAGQTLTSSTGTWSVSPPVTSYGYQWQRCEVSNSPTYVNGWGGAGSGNGQFNTPEWVAVDPGGNVFVADRGNDRIQKFDASGNYLGKWGSAGNGPGQFQNIGGVAVGPGGEVYVTDTGNDRVQKFTNSGIFLTQWGSQGSTNGKFNSPGPLATDSSGNVYVTDYNNARVQKFTANGGYLTQWGSSGSGPGQFTSPGGIAVDPSGNVYVVDIYSHRVEKFTGTGTFLTQWGSNGSGDGQFTSPTGIAVASSGTVYVADRNTSRIQAFSPTGTYLFKWGTAGSGPGQIDDPGGLAFGAGGDLYEADVYNARIQQFETLSCAAISGATASTHPQTRSDMGKTIRVEVTADNDVPPVEEALSFATTPVLAIPEDSSSPTISGSPAVGGTLTANAGNWTGYPEATLTYQWQRCEQDGTGCTEIAGATNPTYTPTGADAGKKLRVAEKGTNVVGDTTANSAQVGPVTGPPVNVEPPSITGDLVLGSTLTANPGTWSGYPTPTLSFQWQRCDAGGSNCSDIAGATGQTYVLIADDEGKEIRIVVTAVNSIDSVRTDSAPTGEVAPVPPTPTGKPKLKVSVLMPKRVRAGKRFEVAVKVRNVAALTRSVPPTTARNLKTCVSLPEGFFVLTRERGRIDGRAVCWTRKSLAAGRSVTYRVQVRPSLTRSGSAWMKTTASASDGSTTVKTSSARRVDVVEPEKPRPEPKPPTG